MTSTARIILRVVALLQFVAAAVGLFYALVFLIADPGHDELGLGRTLRPPFVITGGAAAALLAYGGLRTWRGSRRWWVSLVATIIGLPILFIALWVAGS